MNSIVYCANRKCDKTDCLRYWKNEPWGKLIREVKFTPDKNNECNRYIKE